MLFNKNRPGSGLEITTKPDLDPVSYFKNPKDGVAIIRLLDRAQTWLVVLCKLRGSPGLGHEEVFPLRI